jgi:Niemann-Pick C1 protein
MNIVLALVAVFIVLMIVTANFTVTMFILLCVALVDLFLLGLLTFWDITLNSVTVVNNVIAIGLAVDYSAHIGHAYLLTEAPDTDEEGNEMSNHQKRVYKARGALGSMGSSVFHGAFSTFLAIVVLSPSKSYIFTSFFRMWFGIIIFGVSNGFILLPVLLSLCGPLNDAKKVKKGDEKMDTELNQMNEGGCSSQGAPRIN